LEWQDVTQCASFDTRYTGSQLDMLSSLPAGTDITKSQDFAAGLVSPRRNKSGHSCQGSRSHCRADELTSFHILFTQSNPVISG